MKIHIVSASQKEIVNYLKTRMKGDRITGYDNIRDFYDRISKSGLQAERLVVYTSSLAITDDPTNYNSGFDLLTEVIRSHYLQVDRVIFINEYATDFDDAYRGKFEICEEDVRRKRLKNCIEKEHAKAETYDGRVTHTKLHDILTQENFKPPEIKTNDVVVISKRRGSDITNRQLFPEELSDDIPGYRTVYESDIKKEVIDSLKDNCTVVDMTEHISAEELECIPEDLIPIIENVVLDKTLLVTGGVGVTTTALLFAKRASILGKTLVVDCNFNNMGLSYLMEEMFLDEQQERSVALHQKHNDYDTVGRFARIETNMLLNEQENPSDIMQSIYNQIYRKERLHFLALDIRVATRFNGCVEPVLVNLINHMKTSYDFIILDMPLNLIDQFPRLISKYVNKVLVTMAPYQHKISSTIKQLSDTMISKTAVYKNNKVMMMRLGIRDPLISPVTIEQLNLSKESDTDDFVEEELDEEEQRALELRRQKQSRRGMENENCINYFTNMFFKKKFPVVKDIFNIEEVRKGLFLEIMRYDGELRDIDQERRDMLNDLIFNW